MITRQAAVSGLSSSPLWTVQYRCIYREHWYDDGDFGTYEEAAARAWELSMQGRAVRIVSHDGRVVAATMQASAGFW